MPIQHDNSLVRIVWEYVFVLRYIFILYCANMNTYRVITAEMGVGASLTFVWCLCM